MDIAPEFSPEEQDVLGHPNTDNNGFDDETALPENFSDSNTMTKPSESQEGEHEKPVAEEEDERTAKARNHMVPHGALHAEREERKKAQAEAAEAKAKLARIEERFKIAREFTENHAGSESFSPLKQPRPEAPDPEKDFVGYVKWIGAKLQNEEAERQKREAEERQFIETAKEQEVVKDYFVTSVTALKAELPDFDEAADFLYEARVNQLKALADAYPAFKNADAINAQIGNELAAIVKGALESGTNPAQTIYNYAKNIGFKAKSATGSMAEPMAGGDIAAMRAKKNAARTLTASNGRAIADPVSLEAIDAMSDRQFAEWISNPGNERAFNILMRGE